MDGMTLAATVVVPSLSVVATATVAVWNKRIDATMKRDDRRQEIALEARKRFGEDRDKALKSVIYACTEFKRQDRLAVGIPPEATQSMSREGYRRAIAVRSLGQFFATLGFEEGQADLNAYAGEEVRKFLDAMLDVVETQRQKYLVPMAELVVISDLIDAEYEQLDPGNVAATDVRMARVSELNVRQDAYLARIAKESTLDVDDLMVICDRLLDEARRDLVGGGIT